MKIGLMVPLRRCGSNAIRLRLSMNPHLFCPYPCHLTDLDETMYGDLCIDSNYFSLIVDIIRLQSSTLIPWAGVSGFDPLKVFDWVKNKSPRSKTTVYMELLSRAGKKKGATFVMDKSQDSVSDWRTWVELDPTVKFLDVVRDPRAQISSMNQAVIYDYDTLLNTARWIRSRQYVDDIYKEFPNNILTIRFEDFIADEKGVVQKICDFFGVPFHDFSIGDSQEAFTMADRSPLWASNSSNPDPKVLKKYTKLLNVGEIEHIEATTFSYMKKFGYKTETPARSLLPYSIKEAKEREQQKKFKIWEDLEKNFPFDYILRTKRKEFINGLP